MMHHDCCQDSMEDECIDLLSESFNVEMGKMFDEFKRNMMRIVMKEIQSKEQEAHRKIKKLKTAFSVITTATAAMQLNLDTDTQLFIDENIDSTRLKRKNEENGEHNRSGITLEEDGLWSCERRQAIVKGAGEKQEPHSTCNCFQADTILKKEEFHDYDGDLIMFEIESGTSSKINDIDSEIKEEVWPNDNEPKGSQQTAVNSELGQNESSIMNVPMNEHGRNQDSERGVEIRATFSPSKQLSSTGSSSSRYSLKNTRSSEEDYLQIMPPFDNIQNNISYINSVPALRIYRLKPKHTIRSNTQGAPAADKTTPVSPSPSDVSCQSLSPSSTECATSHDQRSPLMTKPITKLALGFDQGISECQSKSEALKTLDVEILAKQQGGNKALQREPNKTTKQPKEQQNTFLNFIRKNQRSSSSESVLIRHSKSLLKAHTRKRSSNDLESVEQQQSPEITISNESAHVRRAAWLLKKGHARERTAVGLTPNENEVANDTNNANGNDLSLCRNCHDNKKTQIDNCSSLKSRTARSVTQHHLLVDAVQFRARGADALHRRHTRIEELQKQNYRTRVDPKNREEGIGIECSQCEQFYRALDGDGPIGSRHQNASKHRYNQLPPSTPPGYWDLTFPSPPSRCDDSKRFNNQV